MATNLTCSSVIVPPLVGFSTTAGAAGSAAALATGLAALLPLPAILSLPLMLLTWADVILICCLANAATISVGPASGWASGIH